MTIKVDLTIPDGKTCGLITREMCRFLHWKDGKNYCMAFEDYIEVAGRYYTKCNQCRKAMEDGK